MLSISDGSKILSFWFWSMRLLISSAIVDSSIDKASIFSSTCFLQMKLIASLHLLKCSSVSLIIPRLQQCYLCPLLLHFQQFFNLFSSFSKLLVIQPWPLTCGCPRGVIKTHAMSCWVNDIQVDIYNNVQTVNKSNEDLQFICNNLWSVAAKFSTKSFGHKVHWDLLAIRI